MNFNRAMSWSDEGYKKISEESNVKQESQSGETKKGIRVQAGCTRPQPTALRISCGEVKKMRGKEAVNSGLGI